MFFDGDWKPVEPDMGVCCGGKCQHGQRESMAKVRIIMSLVGCNMKQRT